MKIESKENKKWEDMDAEKLGLLSIRGCEIKKVKDESGQVIGEREEDGSIRHPVGNKRTYCVMLDSAQYQVFILFFVSSCF